jgi:hypothetical protein
VFGEILGSFRFDEYDYEYEIRQAKPVSETHAVCLRHPVLTRKSRSRGPSEYEIVEKSRSPYDDFSKKKESWLFLFTKNNL